MALEAQGEENVPENLTSVRETLQELAGNGRISPMERGICKFGDFKKIV